MWKGWNGAGLLPASPAVTTGDTEHVELMNGEQSEQSEPVFNVQSVNSVNNSTDRVLLESFLDSGAARSICPRAHGKQFKVQPTDASRRRDGFLTATGRRVINRGCRTIPGTSNEGRHISMAYAVADVSVAFDSVSQICDKGPRSYSDKMEGSS